MASQLNLAIGGNTPPGSPSTIPDRDTLRLRSKAEPLSETVLLEKTRSPGDSGKAKTCMRQSVSKPIMRRSKQHS